MSDDEHSGFTVPQEHRFANLVLHRAGGHAVIAMDREGVIRGWSSGASYITGFEPREAIGLPLRVLFTPEDRELGLPEQELRAASVVGSVQDERWHLRRDGSRFWASGLTYADRDTAGELTGFFKLFRDATHLRTRMKYLENIVADCAARETERDTFVGTIAHELRNPLQPIKTVLAILKASPDSAGRHGESLKVLDRQLQFLERLVEDLVDLTRASVGKLRVERRQVVVQTVIAEALADCTAIAEGAGVRLHALLPGQPLLAEVDAGRLEQVVINLVSNGVKFTPPGGNVWVSCTADHSHLLIGVKDDGRGIPHDLLPHIFEAFTQARDVSSARGSGLGIGLSVVKEIAAQHGGSVDVRSEGPGKGAEFTVRIPLGQRAPTSLEEAGGTQDDAAAPPDLPQGGPLAPDPGH
jgi:PAS domain S-box-containing protein